MKSLPSNQVKSSYISKPDSQVWEIMINPLAKLEEGDVRDDELEEMIERGEE